MRVPFPIAAGLCSATFAALTLCLMCAPSIVYDLFEVSGSDAAGVLAERTSLLFADLLFTCAGHLPNATRHCVAISVGLILIALAGLGLIEWMHVHNAGSRLFLTAILPFHILIARDALRRVARATFTHKPL